MSPIPSRRVAVRALVPRLHGANQPHAGLWFQTGLAEQESGGGHEAREQLFEELILLPVPPIYRDALSQRREVLFKQPHTVVWEAVLADRLILGLGDETIHETGLRLEHTFGLPVIPGSSFKGALRNYVNDCTAKQQSITESAWASPLKGSKQPPGEAFLAVFGDTEDSGLVQFHDAWWVPADPGSGGAEKPFVRDVITVHHPEYYQESSPPLPSDQDSPTPVPFLAVRGAFLFAVTSPSAEWSDLLKVMVTEMLTTHGVGGKKAAGYGTFIRPKRGPDVPSTELPPQNSQRVPGKVRREGKDTYLIFLEDGSVLNPPPGTTWMKCKKKKLQRLPEGKESGSFSFLVIPREGSWTILEICEAGAPENE